MRLSIQEKTSRLAKVQTRISEACIASARSLDSVKLIAVSKTKPLEDINDFYSLKQRDFGENYVQEALTKIDASQYPDIRWHFIGSLQSNKAKFVPGRFHLFHSLNSEKLAIELNRQCEKMNFIQNCLLEINIDAEESKHGIAPKELHNFLQTFAMFAHLKVSGLMCLPAPREVPSREPFAKLRTLLETANKSGCYAHALTELSMGMSDDFECAILEGATYIRVGTFLFGEREKRA